MKKLRDSFTLLPSPPKVTMVNISNEKIGLDVNLNHLRVGQMQKLHGTPQSQLMNPLIKAWLMDEMNANQVWCVHVPGYLYVFKDKADETPVNVIILQGCQVRPQVFKKPYIAPKMNMSKKASDETNSFQFLIENGEGNKFLFGVENKDQLDQWVDSVEQSVQTKKPIQFGEATVLRGYHSSASILSNRSLSSNDLPKESSQTGNMNEDGSSSFRYLTGVKKKLKPVRQSQVQTSSMDLYRLREEPPAKTAVSANDLRLSLPISMMQTSSSWADMGSKNCSTNDLEGANTADNITKKRGRFSLKRVFSWKKNDPPSSDEVTLSKLNGIRLADHLYYKSNYKWTKVWCVLSDGTLYGFKANKPTEKVVFLISLADANLGYDYPLKGVSKQSRKDFFIELTSAKKSVLVRASSSSDQIRWIQALTKESMSALRSAFHNSKQESECSDDSACSMSSVHSIPNALASSPLTDTQITILPEINSSKLSSFSTEDNGYTTCSEDFDNRSSVGSQNEICDLSLSSCSAQNGTYHAYSERSLNKERHQQDSKMDFATLSTRPRSFSWNNEKCWNECSTRKTPASATLSSPGVISRRPVSLSLGCSPQSKTKSDQKKTQLRRLSAVTSLQLSPQIFMSGYLHRKNQSGKWLRLWFVLKGSTLFSHQKCETPSTVLDHLDLIGCHVCCSVNSEKKHVFEITTQDGTIICYSAESEECLATWIQHLHNITDTCSTSSPSISSDGFFDSREDLTSNDPEEQRQRALKQELLTYVLQQIKDIQYRLKPSDDNEASERQTMEDATCNMTRLVKRRMSTQIKLQSIKKQMNPKKSIFHFGSGSKKKDDKSLNPQLVTEAQELNEKLNEIDRTLNQQQNSQISSTDSVNKQSSNSSTSGSSSILSKSSNPSSKSHRLGLKPIWLRNSRQNKDNRVNNRLSTPSALLQSWGTELSVMEVKSPPPTSAQDTFLKSLDLADGASKDGKPSENLLYKTLPTKKILRTSLPYSTQGSTTHSKIPKYIKILDSEIEAFEMLASSYHSRRTEVSSSSNA